MGLVGGGGRGDTIEERRRREAARDPRAYIEILIRFFIRGIYFRISLYFLGNNIMI